MGDHWPEAELIQVFAYLYRNSRLKIPDSWQDTLSNFYLEVSDIVFPSDTQFVSCIGPKSWWWLKIGVLTRSWLMILTENNWGLPMVGMMPSLSLPSQTCGNHSWYVYTVGIWRNLCNNSLKFEQKSYPTRAQNGRKNMSNGRKNRQTGANPDFCSWRFFTAFRFSNIFRPSWTKSLKIWIKIEVGWHG